jgi:hypothetical protein
VVMAKVDLPFVESPSRRRPIDEQVHRADGSQNFSFFSFRSRPLREG